MVPAANETQVPGDQNFMRRISYTISCNNSLLDARSRIT
jgi:hypothetical protein